jgi:hypothetical protein
MFKIGTLPLGDLAESEATYKRLFHKTTPRRDMTIKTIKPATTVYRQPLEKLLSNGHVIIESNFNMKTPEHKK